MMKTPDLTGGQYQRYFWGEVIPLGGVHLHTTGEKNGVVLHVFGAEGAAKIF